MLRSLKDLVGFRIDTADGTVGKVHDFYFDDEKWAIRYLVVESGGFLSRNRVLISPIALRGIDWTTESIDVSLTSEQVANSPDVACGGGVSRENEIAYFNYYRWPYYWTGAGIWGVAPLPGDLFGVPLSEVASEGLKCSTQKSDTHLRSVAEILGYKIEAKDTHFGHIKDLIVDDASWQIRYLAIDTVSWWPSKSVLIDPNWVDSIGWMKQLIRVPMMEGDIKSAPDFERGQVIDRPYELRLYEHFGKTGYWDVPKERSA